MSSKSWQETLQPILTQTNKLAVVGVGHELRGDDAVGIEIIRRLQQTCPASDTLLLVDGGAAPENATGILRRFLPDTVLLIDAVDMNQTPGSIEWVDWHDIHELAASTHTLSLRLLADYLHSELNCDVFLLGIRPLSTAFDASLSQPIQASILAVVDNLQTTLTQSES